MKNIILILVLFISAPSQAATVAPPDTTTQQQQPRPLPTEADFRDLTFKTNTPDCNDQVRRRLSAERGWWVFGILAAIAVGLVAWGVSTKPNASKKP